MLNRGFRLLLLTLLSTALLGGSCKGKAKPAEKAPASAEAAPKAAAQPAKPAKPAPEPLAVIEAPFFYKVEGPEGAAGHLLGTMHMGIDGEKELPKYVWDARDAAKVIAIEADVTDTSLAMGLMLPDDQNLKDLLGEEHWKKLEDVIGPVAAAAYKPMKPAAAVSAIAIKGMPMTMPMDLYIANKAKESEQDLQYLETAQFQLDMLNKVTDVEFLKAMLDDPESSDSAKMLATYREGDEATLAEEMQDPKSWGNEAKAEANREEMLYKRNEDWIPKLEALFARGPAFVGVGAAHLIGERSVIDLLKKKGYTITRVSE